MESLFFF